MKLPCECGGRGGGTLRGEGVNELKERHSSIVFMLLLLMMFVQ